MNSLLILTLVGQGSGRRKGTNPASSRKLLLVGTAYSLGQCFEHESVQFRPFSHAVS